MGSRFRLTAALSLLVTSVATLVTALVSNPEDSPRAVVAPSAPPQTLGIPARETGEFPGVLLASEAVEITPQVEGVLRSVERQIGDRVDRNQALATVDVGAVRDELNATVARLRSARADAARTAIELEQVSEREKRYASAASHLSPEERAAAAFDVRLKRSALSAARARVREQEALVDRLQRSVAQAVVRSPVAGTVATRYLDPGAVVDRRTPLFRVVSDGNRRVRFAVPEERAVEVQKGMLLRIEIPSVGRSLDAKVERIAPEVDPSARLFVAEASLDQGEAAELAALAGAFVRVLPAQPQTARR